MLRQRRPTQKTIFGWHSYAFRQSDARQLRRHLFNHDSGTVCRLEHSYRLALRSVQTVAEDIFALAVWPQLSVNCLKQRWLEISLLRPNDMLTLCDVCGGREALPPEIKSALRGTKYLPPTKRHYNRPSWSGAAARRRWLSKLGVRNAKLSCRNASCERARKLAVAIWQRRFSRLFTVSYASTRLGICRFVRFSEQEIWANF